MGRWNEHRFWSHFTDYLRDCLKETINETGKTVDVEGTERLLLALLLPRCRALHSLRRNPSSEDLMKVCRCSRSKETVEQINPVLRLLERYFQIVTSLAFGLIQNLEIIQSACKGCLSTRVRYRSRSVAVHPNVNNEGVRHLRWLG